MTARPGRHVAPPTFDNDRREHIAQTYPERVTPSAGRHVERVEVAA